MPELEIDAWNEQVCLDHQQSYSTKYCHYLTDDGVEKFQLFKISQHEKNNDIFFFILHFTKNCNTEATLEGFHIGV